MGYYLSKEHRAILEMFVPTLKSKTEDFYIKVTNPKKFISVLDNSSALEEFKWIKSKWKWRVSPPSIIVFELRGIGGVEFLEPDPPTIDEEVDLFSIMNTLLLDKPAHVRFTNCLLTDDEINRLYLYCDSINLSMTYSRDNKQLEIIRKNA